jgi:hypothetical protein
MVRSREVIGRVRHKTAEFDSASVLRHMIETTVTSVSLARSVGGESVVETSMKKRFLHVQEGACAPARLYFVQLRDGKH